MKNDKLIPGLILVLIGTAFLMHTVWGINFHWQNIGHLWPIFLIVGGINLVFANNKGPLATTLKAGVIILGFVLLLYGGFSNGWGFPVYSYSTHDNDNNNDSDSSGDNDSDSTGAKALLKIEGKRFFKLPYNTATKFAQLNINAGATSYDLSDTTSQLLNADTKEHSGTYEISHFNTGSTYVLNFDRSNHRGFHFNWDSDKSNAVTFRLNTVPTWDINIGTGAADINFDLTAFKIRTLKLEGGFESFKVKLGQPLTENTNVEVSTGFADVDINIPKNAACEIITDSGLSSNSFDGFTKTDDDNYETPGFDAAKSKIIINISGGISNFKVSRY